MPPVNGEKMGPGALSGTAFGCIPLTCGFDARERLKEAPLGINPIDVADRHCGEMATLPIAASMERRDDHESLCLTCRALADWADKPRSDRANSAACAGSARGTNQRSRAGAAHST